MVHAVIIIIIQDIIAITLLLIITEQTNHITYVLSEYYGFSKIKLHIELTEILITISTMGGIFFWPSFYMVT